MKLRQRPEDFGVEEDCALAPSGQGPYGLYRLKKRGITTPEAVRRAARAAGVAPSRVRFCGLKDRHAVAAQTVTVIGKPVRAVHGRGFDLVPLGRSERPAAACEIVANRFEITVRDVSAEEAERLRTRGEAYERSGFANYFDEQRFGSARATGEFPGELAARGDFEGALKLMIATSSREDPKDVKLRRRTLAGHWGDWPGAKAALDRSSERSIVTYLCDHPTDFAGAFDRLPEPLRRIVLSAFQSVMWNEALSWVIRSRARAGTTWLHKGRYDEIVMFEPDGDAAGKLGDMALPFAHRRATYSDADAAKAFEESLARRGLTLDSFRLRGLKKSYFARGERRAVSDLRDFSATDAFADELNPGRFAVTLRFALPAGVYATMLLKAALGPG